MRLVIAANSAWNIVNYRAGLIGALRQAGYEVVVVAPFDPAGEERIRDLGVEHIEMPMIRSGVNPFADAVLFLRYWSVLRRLRPSAYLGFTIKPNIYGGLAARLLGVPAIANISGLGTAFAERGWLRSTVVSLYRLSLAASTKVFFQNADDRDEFVAEGMLRPDQAGLLPGSGVDLDRFEVVPLPSGPPVFLLIGRLLRDKGVGEFVAAARVLRSELPGARFQLLGPLDPGNPTGIAQADLDQWIAEGVVEYLGSMDDVRPAIRGATVIVLPSFYREGVPRSLLEGAAMGRPLIATDSPGCRELVADKPGGIACRPRDAGSLADAMREFAKKSPEQREAMGTASRRLVEERFGEERVIRAYLHELDELARSS